jgi:gamma-D-glutamyl-L-lysine dipeptidyl-peptidase
MVRTGFPRYFFAIPRFALLAGALVISGFAQTLTKVLIRVPVANLFSAPSTDTDVVSQAIYDSEVAVLEQKDGFTHVRTPDSYTGWIRNEDLFPQPAALSAAFAQVRSLSANLYREPDVTRHAPLLTVPFETRLEIIPQAPPENEDYLRVRLLDQREAWIDRGDVDLTPRLLTIPESIDLAKRFLGITYTWGGRSSFGYDCSGFTQMLVRSRGIIMPRDADLQAAWSGVVPVERKHLKPGDLLFFGKAPDHITHTGMYIGKGHFIHDTTNGHPGVQISRLNDQPWTRLLVAARRVK